MGRGAFEGVERDRIFWSKSQMLNYKSYTGSIEISVEDGVLHGSVLDIKDVITFEGETIEEVKQAFQDSVDDYLEFCQETGQDPDRPLLGWKRN